MGYSFVRVIELNSLSMISELIMIEMLILLNTTSLRIIKKLFRQNNYCLFIHQYSGYQKPVKWNSYVVQLNPL